MPPEGETPSHVVAIRQAIDLLDGNRSGD